jgi:PiT family inorganic phosphate transporter
LLFWAVSLSAGLAVFWERLIKTVWSDITKIDQIRAFCVALSATITVLIASTMGLPVSTTQISLGAIFGIWLYRKALSIKKWQAKDTINLAMMKWILLSWLVTLPISWWISAAIYWILVKF